MADARNYKQYRREVLDRLGVQYYDEDIEEFDRWRLKVLQGLKDLYGEENIIRAVEEWLEAHPKYVQVPLADRDNIGGFKIEAMGEPPRPSVRLTTGYTMPYSDVSNAELPLIRDDGTMSPYFIPDATTSVKGAMSASDKAKLDSLGGLKVEVLKTLTTDNDTLYNHNRTVTVYYDGDVLPTVKLYNEYSSAYGYDPRWVYEAIQVMLYTTNDHPEYGEHKAKFWFKNRASSNLTQLDSGSKMICEYNANYAEGGNIEH